MSIFRNLHKLRQKQYSGDVWITKDGSKIPVEDMTDAHLDNAIAHLRRQARRFVQRWGSDFYFAEIATGWWPQGEMAQYYLEQEIMSSDFYYDDIDAEADVLANDHNYSMLMREKKRRENERKQRAKDRPKRSSGLDNNRPSIRSRRMS